MAEALLEFVAQHLLTFVQDELATFLGVDSQIQMLSGYLTAIRAVLRDAEEKQLTVHADDSVKVWLKNLSDAAHVLDDILDSCSIQSKLLKSHNITRLSPKSILFRRHIGKRMKGIVKSFEDIDKQRRTFELHGVIMERRQEDDRKWRQTCSVITEDHIYGRDQDREKIVEFLLRNDGQSDELSVYPIVGMGGHGKTTLARWVFNDDRVKEHFGLMRIWVCVSSNFDVTRILQSIVESTVGINPNLSTLESMQKKVQEVLSGKRYLLVLDDVWNKDKAEWAKLKSVLQCGSGTNGASVLVTTRLVEVASIMGTRQTHHHLSPLSEDDSWSLFKQHAFGANKEERAELVAIGKDILKKCKGSPLASKVLGSLLSDKNEEKQWVNVKESKFWDIPHGDDIMRVLMISYFDLNMTLRRCFSFCAIYPEDFEISKEQLIHLWMANGLIKPKRNLEVEDVGNEVWEELCQRSFFQEVKTDSFGNTSFKIHDLFHELAQSIMGKECKVSKLENMKNLSPKVHHIICPDIYRPFNLSTDVLKKFESLRTFVELWPSYSSYGLKAFSSLRALSTSLSELSGLGSLTHLRYLNIHNSEITALPECVSRLQRLQILKLEDCKYLLSLPKQLTQLTELRHLLIRGCWALLEMPPNIGELKCLKTLNIFILESKRGLSLTELHDLQLGGKLHIKGLENAQSESEARSANLKSKKELSQLYLSWGSSSNPKCTNAEKILEALEPHGNLKSFGMEGYMGKQFPSWIINASVLSCLVSVILYKCKNCEQLPPLGKLPHLANLVVCGMRDVKYIDDDSYDGVEEKAFKSLKKLTLLELPNLEKMLRDGDGKIGMLPLLSELRVSCVPKLELPVLASVERLEIKGWKSDESDDYDSMAASFLERIVPSMPHVKTLHIEHLSGLNGLCSLNSLQELRIDGCDELESFKEDVLQGLSSLRTLSIIGCLKLKSLSEGVGHLTCLENLSIHGCPELVSLPNNMNLLTALRQVDIYGYSTLPEGLQRIPSIQTLSLGGVGSLPEWLGDMTSLQRLLIAYCPEIGSLPHSLQHLTNLHELCIAFSPKLEKWCKMGTGKDRLSKAHIPQVEIIPEPKETLISDKFQRIWNFIESAGYWEFEKLVDDIEGMLIKST